MSGADVFDAKCTAYKVPRKSWKFWKALFYDYLEIPSSNSFIPFNKYRKILAQSKEHPSTTTRNSATVLVRQFGQLDANAPVPLYHPQGIQANHHQHKAIRSHMPVFQTVLHNWKYGYLVHCVQRKTKVFCAACNIYLHVNQRNCFKKYHNKEL